VSRSRHTEAQIIEALRRIEAGQKTEEVARQYGVSMRTIYSWRAGCFAGADLGEVVGHLQLKPSGRGAALTTQG